MLTGSVRDSTAHTCMVRDYLEKASAKRFATCKCDKGKNPSARTLVAKRRQSSLEGGLLIQEQMYM